MKRHIALDRFRGMAIILMVAGNALTDVPGTPRFMQHTPDIGLSFADTIAPLFVFAIALSYRSSFINLYQLIKGKAFTQYAYRYFALIGLGAIFSAGGALVDQYTAWGVLQSLGVAGLLTLLVISFPSSVRLAIGLLLLAGYQILLDRFLLQEVLASPHGGIFGSLSWSAMLILSTVLVDCVKKGSRHTLIGIITTAALAALSAFIVPISKNRVSMSYVLLTIAVSGTWYAAIRALSVRFPRQHGYLACWGVNPLLFYVAHLFLVGLVQLPFALLHIDPRPLIPSYLCAAAIVLLLGLVARHLYFKRGSDEAQSAPPAAQAHA